MRSNTVEEWKSPPKRAGAAGSVDCVACSHGEVEGLVLQVEVAFAVHFVRQGAGGPDAGLLA